VAEGDTIHRTARRLSAAIGDQPLSEARAPNPRSPLARQGARLESLAGRRLERAEARGKHLLLHFEHGLTLHCHQGMSGSWRVRRRGEAWGRPRGSAWLLLATGAAEAAQFGGPLLELRTESELALDPRLRSLGPDVLGEGFNVDVGVAAFRGRSAADRELGEALLDQTVLSGIGNVYKSEGCFASRLNPWRRLGDLDDDELGRLVLETAALMRAGLETGRMPRDVYRRAERPCPRCGTPILARGQGDANRTTYWCPGCQPSLRER
jgi:endonuclease VIII